MPAEIVGSSVQLVLIGCQRGPTEIGVGATPGVDVAVAVEAHHR
jgi:hypothetical protein